MYFKALRSPVAAGCLIALAASPLAVADEEPIEEVRVYADAFFQDTTKVSPSSVITAEELQQINMTTVEDALAHEPSLIVRKRFIGDPNGVIGIRGTNMFQTARTMVFVDGMPLHYHLQTRFRGSPRWSLVSPNEIEQAEVIYGPFSSEFSGNAMGGVVNLRTRRPEDALLTIEAGSFSQEYDQLNTDETFHGYRAFVSFEDKIGDLGYHLSYTRLDNESQPQSQYFRTADAGGTSTAVSAGSIPTGGDEEGNQGVFIGDSGPEQAETDLYKAKFFYDLGAAELRASIAYEERSRVESDRNNYLVDANGNAIFDREVEIGGVNYDTFNFGRSEFQHRSQERESLLLGLGASFELSSSWVGDVFYSYFDVLKDEEIRTGANPADPDFASVNQRERGRLSEYNDTGWNIFDVKFATEELFGRPSHRLSVGFHYDSYELEFIADDYNAITGVRSADELDGDRGTGRSDSGGEARTLAVFAQYGIALTDRWDLALGLRYDDWEGKNGFVADVEAPKRSENGFSPKLSVAYEISSDTSIRYSVARALRFPVIEEIFVNNDRTSGGTLADPNLEPEDGVFHNLSLTHLLGNGSVSVSLFREDIEDVIFNQLEVVTGVTTFLPVGEVQTDGVELVLSLDEVAELPLAVRFNLTYSDAEIVDNVNNPGIEGKDFPRIPAWRANLLARYQVTERIDLGGSIRYASNSFGSLDNSDTESNVFGAHDDFTFVGIKGNWQVTDELRLSAGVDNLFDEEAYVFHPWPGRTYHVNLKYVLSGS